MNQRINESIISYQLIFTLIFSFAAFNTASALATALMASVAGERHLAPIVRQSRKCCAWVMYMSLGSKVTIRFSPSLSMIQCDLRPSGGVMPLDPNTNVAFSPITSCMDWPCTAQLQQRTICEPDL